LNNKKKIMKMKIGDKFVLKTMGIGCDGKPEKARINYPYQPEEVKRMQRDPMVVVGVSEGPDSVYVDVKSYLGRHVVHEHGHMWFLTSDLDVV
jgi:hypothetical protein